ncbi:hypothetical protein XFEB_00281 [Xylella fastidiosa EB92.1]|nr:hypothetical protein XFEB_00281 [Xylella fastidiosa EB92.1]
MTITTVLHTLLQSRLTDQWLHSALSRNTETTQSTMLNIFRNIATEERLQLIIEGKTLIKIKEGKNRK